MMTAQKTVSGVGACEAMGTQGTGLPLTRSSIRGATDFDSAIHKLVSIHGRH